MALFETLILLLFIAAFLLSGARRFGVPYPTLLAIAGMLVAISPFAPRLQINPHLALAIFIAPALLDAAFDTSPRDLGPLSRPPMQWLSTRSCEKSDCHGTARW